MMINRVDFLGGAVLVALGVAVTGYSQRYDLGTMSYIGPGFFPTMLGLTLSVLGMMIMIKSHRTNSDFTRVNWISALAAALSFVGFALSLETLGLVAATMVAIILARFDTDWRSLLRSLVIATSVTVPVVVVFQLVFQVVRA